MVIDDAVEEEDESARCYCKGCGEVLEWVNMEDWSEPGDDQTE